MEQHDIYQIIKSYYQKLNLNAIDVTELSNHIFKSIKKSMTIDQVLNYIADYCVSKTSFHPEYKKIASHIVVDLLHQNTDASFKNVIESLYFNCDLNGNHYSLIADELYQLVTKYEHQIQNMINYQNDFLFDYFGIKTLERSYLCRIRYQKINDQVIKVNKIAERPQHMFMRVALYLHGDNLERVHETYLMLSEKYISHATPTYFNAGTNHPQLSSCFLLGIEDSIDGILETVHDIAKISKWAGGIGLSISDIRGKGSLIRQTNGLSDGIIPLCQWLNMEAKYINQGGKRNGSIAVYIEPWHCDIWEYCELKTNTGLESTKARDLFLALWIPDLFMHRVKNNEMWSLMCPDECPGLTTAYGDEFEQLYLKYEASKKYKKQIKAVDLWFHILQSQIETGMPYMLYKDHVNRKTNHQNLGTIKCSNLCAEILEYSDKQTTSVCNICSICLPKLVINNGKSKYFDFDKLLQIVKILVRNSDLIIDKTFYPVNKAQKSNLNNRPIGIGVQGLADVYNLMNYAFDSPEALKLNVQIFATIYYGALEMSVTLAQELGPYDSFQGSPISKGILQYDMWHLSESKIAELTDFNYDWQGLKNKIKQYGIRNSLLTACMPTASTAQIMGNSECFEPYLTNIFTRSTLAGEFIVINENLVNRLIKENLWSNDLRKKIIVNNGSIQNIDEIPEGIKKIYKTAFELKMKSILDQSIARAPFIDQTQSLNLFMETPDFNRLTSAHFYGWQNGLKTGMYYLRSRPSVDPIQFGIDSKEIKQIKKSSEMQTCYLRPGDDMSECLVCQ